MVWVVMVRIVWVQLRMVSTSVGVGGCRGVVGGWVGVWMVCGMMGNMLSGPEAVLVFRCGGG